MNAAIIGANGQLGSDLVTACTAAGWTVRPLTHADIAVENADSVRNVLASLKPDVVFNTAAFHVVPKCEEDPMKAFAINALGPLHIARVCNEIGAVSVYYSTDYVFDGAKKSPYTEEDRPNPLNVYAASKLTGEYFTHNYARKGAVLRVSGIYGAVPCRAKGGNFITTMMKAAKEKPEVRVVTDEILCPTPTTAIADKSVEVVTAGVTGLFHMVVEGQVSWYDFEKVIFDTLELKTPLLQARSSDFPSGVRRPSYSSLANARLAAAGLSPMPGWREALVAFLRKEYPPR